MAKVPDKQSRLNALRARAEAAIDELSLNLPHIQFTNYHSLLHELEVYQAEIELQNEELLEAQLALTESRDAYETLYNDAPVGYFTLSSKSLIRDVNRTGIDLLGGSRRSLIGRPFTRWIERESQDDFYHHKRHTLEGSNDSCELKMVRSDGVLIDVQLQSSAGGGKAGTSDGLSMAVWDISSRKQAEKHAQKQELLAVVGQLAAGLTHEFNNILQIIIAHARIVQKSQVELLPTNNDHLNLIVEQGKIAGGLVRRILDFGRQSPITMTPIDLALLLQETVRILATTLPEAIEITLDIELDDGLCMVNGDETHLQRVFVNLAFNARDAMPNGGEVGIHVAKVELLPNEPPPAPELTPGSWFVLTVSDAGTGIDPEHINNIFEPFFTTKEVGKGAGLGLAQAHGIIGQHGGVILAESPAEGGTSFTIYLQEIDPPPSSQLP